MALEFNKPLGGGFGGKSGLQFSVGQAESHIHAGPVPGLGVATEELGRVQLVIDQPGFVLVQTFHLFQAALFSKPFDHQTEDIDRKHRRRVIGRMSLGVDAVIEHGGKAIGAAGKQAVSNQHQRDPRRPQILLRAGVDQTVSRDVDGLAEDVGRKVRYQGNAVYLRLRGPFGPVDGVVPGEVHVISLGVQFQFILSGDAVEVPVLGGTGYPYVAHFLRVF